MQCLALQRGSVTHCSGRGLAARASKSGTIRPIQPGSAYPAAEYCSNCGLVRRTQGYKSYKNSHFSYTPHLTWVKLIIAACSATQNTLLMWRKRVLSSDQVKTRHACHLPQFTRSIEFSHSGMMLKQTFMLLESLALTNLGPVQGTL